MNRFVQRLLCLILLSTLLISLIKPNTGILSSASANSTKTDLIGTDHYWLFDTSTKPNDCYEFTFWRKLKLGTAPLVNPALATAAVAGYKMPIGVYDQNMSPEEKWQWISGFASGALMFGELGDSGAISTFALDELPNFNHAIYSVASRVSEAFEESSATSPVLPEINLVPYDEILNEGSNMKFLNWFDQQQQKLLRENRWYILAYSSELAQQWTDLWQKQYISPMAVSPVEIICWRKDRYIGSQIVETVAKSWGITHSSEILTLGDNPDSEDAAPN